MSTATTIIPQDALVARLTREIEDLALEIFATSYGVDWQQAITEAVNCFRDLVSFAIDWDNYPAEWSLTTTAREVALMKQTGCSAEDAIDAIRVADGRPVWAEVLA